MHDDFFQFLTNNVNNKELTFDQKLEKLKSINLDSLSFKIEDLNKSISPDIMKGFLSLQENFYRAIALSKYNNPSISVIPENEKERFTINVVVNEGSSEYDIDATQVVSKLIETFADTMTPEQIYNLCIIIIVGFFTLYGIKFFIAEHAKFKLKELETKAESDDKESYLNSISNLSEQETARLAIVKEIVSRDSKCRQVKDLADNSTQDLLKGFSNHEGVNILGVEIDKNFKKQVLNKTRMEASETRLDGRYQVKALNNTSSGSFSLSLTNEEGENINAEWSPHELESQVVNKVVDSHLNSDYLDMQINAKIIRSLVTDAKIVSIR